MPTPTELTLLAVRYGYRKKRSNAIAAVLCGALPVAALRYYFSLAGWREWLVGLIVGLIWGNAFEYIYHRWLLHQSASPLGAGHRRHHAHIDTPEQAEHVALITSPLNVILLFAINGVPALLLASRTGRWGILAGILIGWAVYLIATEEIHWRIHMNGWLPRGVRLARAYHMSHHARPNSRYNVFLPLFDFLFGSAEQGKA